MSSKRILIILLFLYVFYSDIFISFTGISGIKSILALLFVLAFSIDFVLQPKTYHNKQFLVVPILLMIFFVLIWQRVGKISFFFIIIFGWILTQDSNYSLKLIHLTFWIQFFLVLYEFATRTVIYSYVESGVIAQHTFNYAVNLQAFKEAGFRPKGLFSGTLVAASFIIYLAMIYRNNIKMLVFIFLMAIMVNGRLALIVSFMTLGFKLIKQYDIVLYYNKFRKKFSFPLKLFFLIVPITSLLILILFVLPSIQVEHLLNVFNLKSTSNSGRIYRNIQTILTFFNYTSIQKLFGSQEYVIKDVYGRLASTESGFLSMFLDIGIVGVLYYLYYFVKGWLSDKRPLFNIAEKEIGFKYVILITFLSFLEYKHIAGNVRGILFWFIMINQLQNTSSLRHSFFDRIKLIRAKE